MLTEANERLRRVETRLMRGFEEIGVDLYDQKDWLSVDEASKTIYVATLGRSIQVINNTAKKQGAVLGQVYDVVWRGKALVNLQIYDGSGRWATREARSLRSLHADATQLHR